MSVPPVRIPIITEDGTAPGLDKVKRSLTSTLGDIGKIAAGMLAADLARGIGQFAKDSVQVAVQTESMTKSFNSLRQTTGNTASTVNTLTKATGGMVSNLDLMSSASQYMSLNLPTGGMEDMWQAAIKLGQAMGMDATKSIGDFNVAIGRASPLILDNFGITLKMAEAQEIYAKQLGKSTEELTESEKKMAFQQAAISKLMEKSAALGDITTDGVSTFAQFNTIMTNLQATIGALVLPSIVKVLGAFNNWLTGITGVVEALQKLNREQNTAAAAAFNVEAAQLAVADASGAAQHAAQQLTLAENAVSDAQARSSQLLSDRRDKMEAVTAAEGAMATASQELERRQASLDQAMAFATGGLASYTGATDQVIWSTEQAGAMFGNLQTELSGVQASINVTSAALQGLNSSMDDNGDEQAKLRLEQLKLRDAFEDGRNGQGKYSRENEKLEGKLRDLQISQAEMRIEADDAGEALDKQKTSAGTLQSKMDALSTANDGVATAAENAKDRTTELDEAQIALITTSAALQTSLADVITKQNEASEAHFTANRAIKKQEQAYWSLLAAQDASKAEEQRKLQLAALGRMGINPSFAGVLGMAEGGIVTKPTLALIGEAGPEAVVPLSGSGGGVGGVGGTSITINKLADSISLDPNGMDLNELTNMLLNEIADKMLLSNITNRRV